MSGGRSADPSHTQHCVSMPGARRPTRQTDRQQSRTGQGAEHRQGRAAFPCRVRDRAGRGRRRRAAQPRALGRLRAVSRTAAGSAEPSPPSSHRPSLHSPSAASAAPPARALPPLPPAPSAAAPPPAPPRGRPPPRGAARGRSGRRGPSGTAARGSCPWLRGTAPLGAGAPTCETRRRRSAAREPPPIRSRLRWGVAPQRHAAQERPDWRPGTRRVPTETVRPAAGRQRTATDGSRDSCCSPFSPDLRLRGTKKITSVYTKRLFYTHLPTKYTTVKNDGRAEELPEGSQRTDVDALTVSLSIGCLNPAQPAGRSTEAAAAVQF